MSVFCVFGVKRQKCVEKARKIVPDLITYSAPLSVGRSAVTRFSIAQHSAFAELLADHLFSSDEEKISQIAPAFDAPQFAMDWMEVAVKTNSARRMTIMVKKPKTDKNGDQIRRKGELVMSWQEWSPA